MDIKTKYFLIAILIMGSVGIWLPIALEALIYKKVTLSSIPPNVTTYFVSLLCAGCIDFFLSKIKDLSILGIMNIFFNLIFVVLLAAVIVIGAILLNIYDHNEWALLLGVIGVIISYRIWWIANSNNPNFLNESTLGGNPNNKLADGN